MRSLDLTADKAAPFKDLGKFPEDIKADINAAYANGLIKGTTAETFKPKKAIPRAEMVTVLIPCMQPEERYRLQSKRNFI
ncbi:S-layer homology domain-containing protein [Cytobacillus oceanisediminis]|uniref:S-layer homology domain-containing protein n=1 Tax=Cytobacillus oceanisediminis TaxID=665099 RepID=UPI0015E83345|nr:S-layer homology domain-containing protein [Cytobacillus oceanisediminis]